jgi:uncharacterized protein involved in outer membrane biogenesis
MACLTTLNLQFSRLNSYYLIMTLKKIIKKAGIATAIIVVIYLVLLAVAGIYINRQNGEISKKVLATLQDKLHGNIRFANIGTSVWQHFPYLSLEVKGLSISDSLYDKPLLSVEKVSVQISPLDLLTANKDIDRIKIENGTFHLFTDSNGYRNDYLLKPKKQPEKTEEKDTGASETDIDKILIEKMAVIIESQPANKEISFTVNKLSASIDQAGNIFGIDMQENIMMQKGLGFNLARGSYLEQQSLTGKWKMQYDIITRVLSFSKKTIHINNHPYELSGFFNFVKGKESFKVAVNTSNAPFESAKAIVTASIRQKIEMVKMKAPINISGVIEGSLEGSAQPMVNIQWNTANNTLETPVANFSNCTFAGNFINNVQPDSAFEDANSMIAFSSFKGSWDGINLSGNDVTITNLDSPILKFNFYSECTFEVLDTKLALTNLKLQDGTANLRLFYNGPLSTTDLSTLKDVEGEMQVRNGTVRYVPKGLVFTNCNGNVSFYKDSISVKEFTCNLKKNKLKVQIESKHLRRTFLANDLSQQASVNCLVTSPFIDLEDFTPLFGANKKSNTTTSAQKSFVAIAGQMDELLDKSIIAVAVKADNVKHQHLEAKNFVADIKFHPHHWEVAKASLNIAGGFMEVVGKITEGSNGNHDGDISTKINNVDIKKLLYAFDNFKQDAVTSQHITGTFNSTASLKMFINTNGKIVPASLFGNIDFSLKNGSLQNFPALANIKNFVFKNRDMADVRFAEIKDRFDIKGTEVYINRMEVASSVLRLFIEGNYGLTGKNTELLLQIPLSNLNNNNFDDGVAPKRKGIDAKVGMSVWLRAVNDDKGDIKVKFTMRKKLLHDLKNEPED